MSISLFLSTIWTGWGRFYLLLAKTSCQSMTVNGSPSMQRQAVGPLSGLLGLALAWVGQIFLLIF